MTDDDTRRELEDIADHDGPEAWETLLEAAAAARERAGEGEPGDHADRQTLPSGNSAYGPERPRDRALPDDRRARRAHALRRAHHRQLAREIGFVKVARRMHVREDWLADWERAQRRLEETEAVSLRPSRRRPRRAPVVDYANLPDEWWRNEA